MENKPIISKKELESKLKEIFTTTHKMGIEDNGSWGYTIHCGDGTAVHTNEAGVEQFNKAMKDYAQKEWTEAEIQ